jgi:transposase
MTRTRRKFDREFKLRAVELSYQRDNIKALSDELEIRPELLYRWRTEFANDERYSFSGNGNRKMTEEESKVVQLEKQLSDMRMERDILKKAIGIFSKSDGKHFNS